MEILIVSKREKVWNAFTDAIVRAGHNVAFVPDAPDALERLKKKKPDVLIWDLAFGAQKLRENAVAVMMIDVRIHQCAATPMAHNDFHDLAEGLGLLPELPDHPNAHDAAKFLHSVELVS